MSADSTKLNERLVKALNEVVAYFHARGLDVFMFGSLARTFPFAKTSADIDLGIQAAPDIPTDTRKALKREASDQLKSLPTIRAVDVVDFDEVGERFKIVALASRLDFPLPYDGSDDTRELSGF